MLLLPRVQAILIFSHLFPFIAPKIMKIFAALFGLTTVATLGSLLVDAAPARADLTVCNDSSSTAYVSVAYSVADNRWKSEGWWRIPKKTCDTVVQGELDGYYYLYAADEDEKFVWEGDKPGQDFCVVKDEDYKLVFDGDACRGAGTTKRKFFELDLRGQSSFTQRLTD